MRDDVWLRFATELEPDHVIGSSPDGKEKLLLFLANASPFSNFHPANFVADSHHFNCSEQYYLYKKVGMNWIWV